MQPETSKIVRNARNIMQQNQHDFAKTIGKTQSVLSRYESGKVTPPMEIIMQCMHIVNTNESTPEIDEIIDKLRALNGEEYAKLREAISVLLDRCLYR